MEDCEVEDDVVWLSLRVNRRLLVPSDPHSAVMEAMWEWKARVKRVEEG